MKSSYFNNIFCYNKSMKKISNKLSTALFNLFLGGFFPLLFFLLAWFGSVGRVAENRIFIIALAGLIWGVLLNYLVLKRILAHLYSLPLWVMVIVYLFYSICVYGFFMGFPLFNLLLGIPAGLYMSQRVKEESTDRKKKTNNLTSFYTSFIMLFLCFMTAFLVLREKTFRSELKSMLNLTFVVTRPLLLGLIIIGSIVLIICQYFLTSYYFNKGE
jgi:hypothetical protein